MIHPIRLSDLKPLPPEPGARQRTLEMIERYQTAQKELERVCAEKGIPVPQLMC